MKTGILFFLIGCGFLALVSLTPDMGTKAQEGIAIPPPVLDMKPASSAQLTAILAGGCFWGVQGVFQHVEGVTKAISGYAGGDGASARYDLVINGTTSHAESVKIIFDPSIISYGEILQIYFSIAHDPTQLNRQGPDRGSHYRSAIFPQNEHQSEIAKAYIKQLNAARLYDAAIVTNIEENKTFYPAEDYHQDYMVNNPHQPYIMINDLPKVENLQQLFPQRFRPQPRLVAQTGI